MQGIFPGPKNAGVRRKNQSWKPCSGPGRSLRKRGKDFQRYTEKPMKNNKFSANVQKENEICDKFCHKSTIIKNMSYYNKGLGKLLILAS